METQQLTAGEDDRPASLLSFAEQMVIEAERASAQIRRDAEEQSRKQAQQVLEAAQNEAAAKSGAITARAEQEAQQVLREARKQAQDILQAASQKAGDRLSQAAAEAEFAARQLTARVTEEIRSAVTKVLPSRDGGGEATGGKSGGRNGKDRQPAPNPSQSMEQSSNGR